MLKNLQWEYPLAIPSINEIISDGIDAEESANIHTDISSMNDLTRIMRRGEFLELVDPSEIGGINHYYDGYLPHYKEFADALIEYRHTIDYMEEETFHFTLGSTPIPKVILDVLQNALQQTHFHKLDFYPNNLRDVGYVNFIANCISSDARLKSVALHQINFEHTRDIDILCDAINTKYSLEALELSDCESNEGDLCHIFNKLKSKSLQRIYLGGNNLANLRRTDMSEFLSSNPSLRLLTLWSIPFNEEDVNYIADALRNNTTLRKLVIEASPDHIPTNWNHIESAVFNQRSLNAAYDSNHVCSIKITHTQSSILDKLNKYNDPVNNRRKKIYNILSTRNRRRENTAHFESDGISVKHIPRILALLKPLSEHHLRDNNGSQHEDEVKPLSIAFEIMRYWKIPELYNNLDLMEED